MTPAHNTNKTTNFGTYSQLQTGQNGRFVVESKFGLRFVPQPLGTALGRREINRLLPRLAEWLIAAVSKTVGP